jgi:hypothetical protein
VRVQHSRTLNDSHARDAGRAPVTSTARDPGVSAVRISPLLQECDEGGPLRWPRASGSRSRDRVKGVVSLGAQPAPPLDDEQQHSRIIGPALLGFPKSRSGRRGCAARVVPNGASWERCAGNNARTPPGTYLFCQGFRWIITRRPTSPPAPRLAGLLDTRRSFEPGSPCRRGWSTPARGVARP